MRIVYCKDNNMFIRECTDISITNKIIVVHTVRDDKTIIFDLSDVSNDKFNNIIHDLLESGYADFRKF